MNKYSINDIEVDECILFQYPDSNVGTVIIDKIYRAPITSIQVHENYGNKKVFQIIFSNGYCDRILKINKAKEWDFAENKQH